jgi:hypothetical protein
MNSDQRASMNRWLAEVASHVQQAIVDLSSESAVESVHQAKLLLDAIVVSLAAETETDLDALEARDEFVRIKS